MYAQLTGSKQVEVRRGYSDEDTYGQGNYCFAATGNLDAPDYIPQGSVRVHNTIKLNPQLSLAHRDYAANCMAVGCGHDGPGAVPATLYLHA